MVYPRVYTDDNDKSHCEVGRPKVYTTYQVKNHPFVNPPLTDRYVAEGWLSAEGYKTATMGCTGYKGNNGSWYSFVCVPDPVVPNPVCFPLTTTYYNDDP